MNIRPPCRWLFTLAAQMFFIAWSSPAVSSNVTDSASEDEFWRTTYCVAGGLPMEVQLSLPGNPRKLEGDSFSLSDVDRVSENVDIKVAALLRDSVASAWKQMYADGNVQWSTDRTNELAQIFVVEIVERAPRSLGIDFCGSNEKVGNAAYAAIIGYFSRSLQLDGGRSPEWLAHAKRQSSGGMTVMLAVALRLAKITFDTEKLVQALAE